MSALTPRAKYPSFKFEKPGDKFHVVVTQEPADSQVRNFDSGQPEFWPDGNPVMQTRIVGNDASGYESAIYAKGQMAKAITDALVKAGASDIEVGAELVVTFTQYGTPKKQGARPPKMYAATYEKPTASAVDHADDDEPPF